MQVRKIQKTGGLSFSVVLPKKWIKINEINESCKVEFIERENGTICIRKKTALLFPTAESYLNDLNMDLVDKQIMAYYVTGFSDIKIFTEIITPRSRSFIADVAQKLEGFKLFELSKNTFILKKDDTKSRQAVDIFFEIASDFRLFVESIKAHMLINNRTEADDDFQTLRKIEKSIFFFRRQVNMKTFNFYTDNTEASKIVDLKYYKQIAQLYLSLARETTVALKIFEGLIKEENGKVKKMDKDQLSRIAKLIKLCIDMVHKPNKLKAEVIIQEIYRVKSKLKIYNKDADKTFLKNMLYHSYNLILSNVESVCDETLCYLTIKKMVH